MSGNRRLASRVTTAAAILLAVACLSACGAVSNIANKAAGQASDPPVTSQVIYVAGKNMIGYWASGFPWVMTQFHQAEQDTGVQANIAPWFISMPTAFDPSEARKVSGQGVLPLVEMASGTIPLAQIAAGRWDTYLTNYARAVGRYASPVAIDFDHEFNESWTQWGYRHTTAATFVAAWRNIVSIFRANEVNNVIWVWNPGVLGPNTVSAQSWYPGDSYVTWVGLDGYFSAPAQTFQSVFGQTLRQISSLTHKKVLITETAVNPGTARVSQINSLFAGIESTPQVIGLIWFASNLEADRNGVLQGDRSAVAAFRADWLKVKKP